MSTKPLSKWLYLLPNLFTSFTLSAGFFSIIMSVQNNFYAAAIAIFVAFFADGFDGFTARLTKTQSKFGAEYDSFSDLIAFGLAPAILAYLWSLSFLGNDSWIIALCYTLAAAIRLARFNAQLTTNEKNYFKGLPSPIAAGMLSSTICLFNHLDISGASVSYLLTALTIVLSVLMVSTIRYYSIRSINSVFKWIFFTTALFLVIALTIKTHPEGFFCLFLIYISSTVFIYFPNLFSKKAHALP